MECALICLDVVHECLFLPNHLLYPVYGFGNVLLHITQERYGSSQGAARTGENTDVCITAEVAAMQLWDSSSSITHEKAPEILLHLKQHLLWHGAIHPLVTLRWCFLAVPDTPYSVSDILVLAQQTGNHRVYGFKILCETLWMACCYSVCQEYQPLSEPLNVCWLHLVWTGTGGGGHHVGVPLCVHVWGSECLNITCIRIFFLNYFYFYAYS